jgi:hypothetical protein
MQHQHVRLSYRRIAAALLLLAMSSPALRVSAAQPPALPGAGLAEHPFLYAGEWDHRHAEQTAFIVRDGRIEWSCSVPGKTARGTLQEISDATLRSDGCVVLAYMGGAALIAPDKRILWQREAPAGYEIHVAQPVGLDRVMIVQNGNPATMMLIDIATDSVVKRITLPTGNPVFAHGHFRRARLTRAGTLLAAHMDNNKVAEYDMDGKEVWALAVLSPWAAVRLHNGNTLVSSNRGYVREFAPDGRVIWEFSQADAPQYRLFGPQEANRLANGNTVISYWCPGGLKDPRDWPGSIQILEVTPGKQVVWALSAWTPPADLGPATCIQLLDEPGHPEDGDQMR